MLKPEVLCKWPISFLQEKLYGICTGDLIVVACASGTGKSVISRLVTLEASKSGCPVVLYSLENKDGTVATEFARDAYVRETRDYNTCLRLFAIQAAKDKKGFEKYRRVAYENSTKKTVDGLPLTIIHEEVATQDWTIGRLVASMQEEINQGYRLFVIDHLDVLAPNDEYKETKIAMNELWGLVAKHNLAILTFSQLNKNCTALCPSQTDLRGGMNKVFKATHVITLGKHEYGYYTPPRSYPNAKPTYIRLVKSRDTPLSSSVCYFNGTHYVDEFIEVLCDEPGTYIDGMNREKLQKYQSKLLNKE